MYDQLIALLLFLSSVGMLIGMRKTENRLLGIILLFMAALKFFDIGMLFGSPRQDTMLFILKVLTGVTWLGGGILGLRKKGAA